MATAAEGVFAATFALPWALLFALCRAGPLFIGVPFLGWVGRILLGLLGGGLLAPLLLPAAAAVRLPLLAPAPSGTLLFRLGPLLLHELGIGLLLWLFAAMPWAVLHAAGRLVGAGRFFSRGEGPVERLWSACALGMFFGLGGAATAITALAKSYALWPLLARGSSRLANPAAAEPLFALLGPLFALPLSVGLPVLGARLVLELAMALLFRPSGRVRLHAPILWPHPALGAIGVCIELAVLVACALALTAGFRTSLLAGWPALFRAFSG